LSLQSVMTESSIVTIKVLRFCFHC
jgi:hypothetical protein